MNAQADEVGCAIWFDGSSSPQKKDGAGWGVAVENGPVFYGDLPPNATNNQAEMVALINALYVAAYFPRPVYIYGDSQLAVNVYNDVYGVKAKGLVALAEKIKSLRNATVRVGWKGREANIADRWAKLGKERGRNEGRHRNSLM